MGLGGGDSGVARISSIERSKVHIAPKGASYQKLKTHRIWPTTYFLEGAQIDKPKQEIKIKSEARGPSQD